MRVITKNKKAYLDYEISEMLEAGIVLRGFEVKSIKMGSVNIKDAIVKEMKGDMIITNMDIPLYKKTNPDLAKGYDPKGIRKLLMNKKEIAKWAERSNKTGLTIVALEVLEMKNRLIKIQIGLGKLRKKVDKKQILKERDIDREAKKSISEYR